MVAVDGRCVEGLCGHRCAGRAGHTERRHQLRQMGCCRRKEARIATANPSASGTIIRARYVRVGEHELWRGFAAGAVALSVAGWGHVALDFALLGLVEALGIRLAWGIFVRRSFDIHASRNAVACILGDFQHSHGVCGPPISADAMKTSRSTDGATRLLLRP